ncbi:hypothetical protein AVEN_145020-1 [Araneus ventricosus]|uniref:Uncharacterized protein n=1 Tax=Araneus ventricosus TaxID=182803 RepID=A0A4Y2J7Y2_ARAVE|nr:hypothetical protein AVEN_145020-1 [Araneus ventricosus]
MRRPARGLLKRRPPLPIHRVEIMADLQDNPLRWKRITPLPPRNATLRISFVPKAFRRLKNSLPAGHLSGREASTPSEALSAANRCTSRKKVRRTEWKRKSVAR